MKTIGRRVEKLVQDAINSHPEMKDGVFHIDVSFTPSPKDGVIHLLYLVTEGALVGTSVTTLVAIPAAHTFTKEIAKEAVGQAFIQLCDQKKKQLELGNEEPYEFPGDWRENLTQ